MGEAKRRKEGPLLVYHHTSTLRTNMLWMSGHIAVEGDMEPAIHPQLGELRNSASLRRSMQDFPPLAWFTTRMDVPQCLLQSAVKLIAQDGTTYDMPTDVDINNAIALDRMALGFRVTDIPVTRWADHPGYATGEGRDLNDSARDFGDDPEDWWVSEVPIDLMLMAEIRAARRPSLKLVRQDRYLHDVKRMVQGCRDNPGAFIPPTWLTPEQAKALAKRLGLPAYEAGRMPRKTGVSDPR